MLPTDVLVKALHGLPLRQVTGARRVDRAFREAAQRALQTRLDGQLLGHIQEGRRDEAVQLVLSAAAQHEARPLVQPVLALLIDGSRSDAFPLVKPQMLQLVDGPRKRGSRLVLRLLDVLRAAAAQTNDRNGGH
jgi:hypothetical protein